MLMDHQRLFLTPIPMQFKKSYKGNAWGPQAHDSLGIPMPAPCLSAMAGVLSHRCCCLLTKGKAKSAELSIVAREIALDQATGLYEFTILQHLNTKLNKLADPLSRQHDPNPPASPSKELGNATRVPIIVGPDFWKIRLFGKAKF